MDSAGWKKLVAQGYDAIAGRYLDWSGGSQVRLRQLEKLLALLPPAGAHVLELGCGAGVPVTLALAERHAVTGLDISSAQISRARENVAKTDVVFDDMTMVSSPPTRFDAVVAFYSITHVPRAEQPELLLRIATWLRPGGWFMASLGSQEVSDVVVSDWLGAANFFSHFDAATNRRLVVAAGLDLIDSETLAQDEEGETGVEFLWVIGRKPEQAPDPIAEKQAK